MLDPSYPSQRGVLPSSHGSFEGRAKTGGGSRNSQAAPPGRKSSVERRPRLKTRYIPMKEKPSDRKSRDRQPSNKKIKSLTPRPAGAPVLAGLSKEQLVHKFKELLLPRVPGNQKWGEAGVELLFPIKVSSETTMKDFEGAVPLDQAAAKETFGTDGAHAVQRLAHLLAAGAEPAPATAVAVMRSMEPRNVIEGMLMAEMLMSHEQVFRLLRMSRQADLPADLVLRCVSAATACSRAFQEGMEALTRFRSGGRQQVVVSHVHVQGGAQAAIAVGGDVRAGQGVGGGTDARR